MTRRPGFALYRSLPALRAAAQNDPAPSARLVPPPGAKQLHAEVVAAVNGKDTQERVTAPGAEAMASSPGEFATMARVEIPKWGMVAPDAGLQLE